MFPQRDDAGLFVTLHECAAKCRYLLRVVTSCANTKWLIPRIGENIKTWPEDPVDSACCNLLGCCFCYFEGEFSGACRGHSHVTRVLADVDLIKQTVNASVLLIDANGQGYWVPCIVGYFL
jgi:hypothetical protein